MSLGGQIRRRCGFRLAAIALAVVAGAVGAWRYDVVLRAAGRWLDVSEPPAPADYVLVLPGDRNTRPFVAAALVQAGLVQTALVPEVKPGPDVLAGIRRPLHEVIGDILRHCGVPGQRIKLLPGQSTSTYHETLMLARFLAQRPKATVNVVTSHFHSRRTRMLLRHALSPDAFRRVRLVAAPADRFRLEAWWRTEDGFAFIAEEYVKLAAYWMRYGDGPWWLGGAAALAAGVLIYRTAGRKRAFARRTGRASAERSDGG